jgi:hypothetical protein
VRNGLSQSTIRALVAHRWRSVGGAQSLTTETTVARSSDEARRAHRLWTAVVRLSDRSDRPEECLWGASRRVLAVAGLVG